MKRKSIEKSVQVTLTEMERQLSRCKLNCAKNPTKGYTPYKGEMDIRSDSLCSKDFMITCQDGSFTIFFRFNTCPVLIAQILEKLGRKFKLKVGEPFYPSPYNQTFYWGCECFEKFSQDLRTGVLNDQTMDSILRHMKKDYELEN